MTSIYHKWRTTSIFWKMEENLNLWKMKDNLNILTNVRFARLLYDFFHCILLFLTEVKWVPILSPKQPKHFVTHCWTFYQIEAYAIYTRALTDFFVIQYIQYKYIVHFSNAYNYWTLNRQACFCCSIIMINCIQRFNFNDIIFGSLPKENPGQPFLMQW